MQLAISSRLQYQFSGGSSGGGLNKEFLIGLAQERNKVALPRVLQNEWGVRLPSERFVLTGVPWGLKGEWVEDVDEEGSGAVAAGAAGGAAGDSMEGVVNHGQEQEDEITMKEEEGEGRMEDLFGGQDDDIDMEE